MNVKTVKFIICLALSILITIIGVGAILSFAELLVLGSLKVYGILAGIVACVMLVLYNTQIVSVIKVEELDSRDEHQD
jgi:hypothetical protein